MISRRQFISRSSAALLGATLLNKVSAAILPIPEAPIQKKATTTRQPPFFPPSGRPYLPVVTLNGWTLPWKMRNGWKEFHLVAEPVVRELTPGVQAQLWGYNGQSPGPTIEAVEGDKVRIFVTNKLREPTTVHWHGMRVPCGMDGVGGLTQPPIPPGKTFVYEFELRKHGTFMYHPHSDEVTQIAMGLMGAFIVHPKDPNMMPVDRDFVFLMAAYAIDPGAVKPRVDEMTNFNWWTWNSRVFPGIDPLVARYRDRVRIRFGNLTMTNHPIHLHGYAFEVTGTDGGWIPKAARWPEVTVDVGVGQMRVIEFNADQLGDWAFHCHKSHHMVNGMNHMMGQNHESMAGMTVPEHSPLRVSRGPFGNLEMGGMFTVLKVREGLASDDYQDPGGYQHPAHSVAYESAAPF